MSEEKVVEVESTSDQKGKLVIGMKGINNPTPMWATWIFRIVFLLTTAATFIIAGDVRIDGGTKAQIFMYMKAFDFVIWGLGRGIGIEKSQFEEK